MSALGQASITAVLAGGGGIGAAVAQRLLDAYPVERLFVLKRSAGCPVADSRCTVLPVDATKPDSVVRAGTAIAEQCDAVHVVFNAVGILHGDGFSPEVMITPSVMVKPVMIYV